MSDGLSEADTCRKMVVPKPVAADSLRDGHETDAHEEDFECGAARALTGTGATIPTELKLAETALIPHLSRSGDPESPSTALANHFFDRKPSAALRL